MSASDGATAGSNSDDMDKLLQSALDDFDKPIPTSSEPFTSKEKDHDEIVAESSSKLQEDFEEKFKMLLSESNESTFVNSMSSLLMEVQNKMELQPNVSGENDCNSVSQAIDSLMQNMEQIKDNNMSKDEKSFTFDDSQNENVFPFMEQMFQMLMRKEILYPSLMAVKEQYPTWLAENKDKTDAAEIDRYSTQYNVIKKICDIFESENDSDAEDVKQKRFSELLRLLEEMSALGQPPADFADSLSSHSSSMPMFNDTPDSCNTM